MGILSRVRVETRGELLAVAALLLLLVPGCKSSSHPPGAGDSARPVRDGTGPLDEEEVQSSLRSLRSLRSDSQTPTDPAAAASADPPADSAQPAASAGVPPVGDAEPKGSSDQAPDRTPGLRNPRTRRSGPSARPNAGTRRSLRPVEPPPEDAEIDRVLWLAGREPLAGLPAVRAGERARESRADLERLARELESKHADAWGARVDAILAADETVSDELWASTARAVGELRRYRAAPLLARVLATPETEVTEEAEELPAAAPDEASAERANPSAGDTATPLSPPSSSRIRAARAALRELFGRWFANEEEVRPYLDVVEAGPDTALFLDQADRAEARVRDHALAALAHDLSSSQRLLEDPDPLLRAGAANVLGDWLTRAPSAPFVDPPSESVPEPEITSESESPTRAKAALESEPADSLEWRRDLIEELLRRLDVERDPVAYHALLNALAIPLDTAAFDAPEVQRLRAHLLRTLEASSDGRALSIAQALARLPWNVELSSGEAALPVGIDALGRLLTALDEADLRRGQHDSDPILGTLLALQALSRQAEGMGLSEALARSSARAPVLKLVEDETRQEVVRAAAVSVVGAFALQEDWKLLVDVLTRGNPSSGLSHALLGALRSILLDFEPDAPAAGRILAEVCRLAAAPDPDLRRRTLALLADERLEPHLHGLDLSFLVQRLAEEDVTDLSEQIVGLIQRFGTPEMLPSLLESERFGELATGGRERTAQLARALRMLSGGSGPETFRAARSLASVSDSDSILARRREAVGLLATLDQAVVSEFEPAQHRTLCSWVWELYIAGVPLLEMDSTGVLFVQRLVEVHWPKSGMRYTEGEEQNPIFDEAARQHLLAAGLGTLMIQWDSTLKFEEVERAFERALTLSNTSSLPDFHDVVLRDRARFRADVGERIKALVDYRVLERKDALEIPDLRRMLDLLRTLGEASAAGPRAVAPEVFQILGHIIGRPSWREEPAAYRFEDMRELGEAALLSDNPEIQERFLGALADLPDSATEKAEEAGVAVPVDAPLWFGLTDDPGQLATLQDLRRQAAEILGR